MRTSRVIFLVLLTTSLLACEVTDVGRLAVTWQFNGHGPEGGATPCGGIGADRVVIEVDGPAQFAEVVACDNLDPDYPLLWLGFAAELPVSAYGRLMRDLPKGTYDVRVYFIDARGNQTAEPAPLEERVTIEREQVARLDLDFAVTTGAINARWRVAGAPPTMDVCAAVDASFIQLQAYGAGGGALAGEVTAPCNVLSGATIAGLAPGDYDLSGQLLDAQSSPITDVMTQTDVTVAVASSASASLDFPWGSFTVPLPGNLRFRVAYDDESMACSAVTGLASGPLRTRLGLADDQGAAVTGVTAWANPDAQAGCAGLTAAQDVDGVDLAPCTDEELILCDLQAGDYQLTVAALDASDLVCYGATMDVEVSPVPQEAPVAVVVASSDASACWE